VKFIAHLALLLICATAASAQVGVYNRTGLIKLVGLTADQIDLKRCDVKHATEDLCQMLDRQNRAIQAKKK
jgi:hypothetical protein